MNAKRLRIGFVKSAGAAISNWSGTPFYMARALERNCGEVIHYSPVSGGAQLFTAKVVNKLLFNLIGKRFNPLHTYALAKRYARHFDKEINSRSPLPDFLFACAATTDLCLLDTNVPIISASDITARLSIDYYDYTTNLLDVSARTTEYLERRHLQKSRALTYCTNWAANSATRDYDIPKDRVFVAPYGANMNDDSIPVRAEALQDKQTDICKLLFLGVEWKRKGGEIAVDALKSLLNMGINAELTVCGCIPPKRFNHPKIRVIPFLSKNDKNDMQEIARLLLESHFLLLPTRAEAFGIVFCEASAFGLPSITTDTGGVSGVVSHGINGCLHSVSAGGEQYAQTIAAYFSDKTLYNKLRKTSREEYESRLNWDAWGKSVLDVARQVL